MGRSSIVFPRDTDEYAGGDSATSSTAGMHESDTDQGARPKVAVNAEQARLAMLQYRNWLNKLDIVVISALHVATLIVSTTLLYRSSNDYLQV